MTDLTNHEPIRHWPTAMAELAQAEGFVVWSFRRWVLGLCENCGAHWDMVAKEFRRQLGDADSQAALASFAGLIRVLQMHTQRRIRHHHPCCPGLSADEAWMISLVAACQHGDGRRARGLVEWMVAAEAAGNLLASAQGLARQMARHGLVLPQRLGAATAGAAPTLH